MPSQTQLSDKIPSSDGVQLSSDDSPTRVYLIGEYGGVRPPEFADKYAEWGDTEVLVKDEQKPVILVLMSYLPTRWNIHRESSHVNIQKIISSSYFANKVKAPDGVPVESSWYQYLDQENRKGNSRRKNPFEPFTLSGFGDIKSQSEWPRIEQEIKTLTGQAPYKFSGRYFGDKFTI